jgi:hypothetical protein
MAERARTTRAGKKKKNAGRVILILLIAAIAICAAVFGGMFIYTKSVVGDSEGKILPGTTVSDLDLGGMTKEEAVQAITDKVNKGSLVLTAENKEVSIDLAKTKAEYDAGKTADKAYALGRESGFFDNFGGGFDDLFLGRQSLQLLIGADAAGQRNDDPNVECKINQRVQGDSA